MYAFFVNKVDLFFFFFCSFQFSKYITHSAMRPDKCKTCDMWGKKKSYWCNQWDPELAGFNWVQNRLEICIKKLQISANLMGEQ
jgi:hypothetical protein